MDSSPYYKDTGKIAFASRMSVRFREQMFAKFMTRLKPDARHKVLDIGVTSDDTYHESNYFERLYPHKEQIVCVGTEDGRYLETKYAGVTFHRVRPHEPLPFGDQAFDIAFSNAVIEHVGSREQQRAFVAEMLRVSRSFFITTPNRWFPIEFHTALPFLHFFPQKAHRGILSLVGHGYWSREDNLNLLGRKELVSLFPKYAKVKVDRVGMLGMSTNLIAYGSARD